MMKILQDHCKHYMTCLMGFMHKPADSTVQSGSPPGKIDNERHS